LEVERTYADIGAFVVAVMMSAIGGVSEDEKAL
jgi:hypothetical protein